MPKKKKRLDPTNKKVRSIRSSLRKYGISGVPSETIRGMLTSGVVCPYCKEAVAVKNVSVDHIQPRSKGGADAWENIQLVCKKCNAAKSNLTHAEFLLLMGFLDLHPAIRQNVLPRLRGGGAYIYG